MSDRRIQHRSHIQESWERLSALHREDAKEQPLRATRSPPSVSVFFKDGRVEIVRSAVALVKLGAEALCLDSEGREVARYPAGEIVAYTLNDPDEQLQG